MISLLDDYLQDNPTQTTLFYIPDLDGFTPPSLYEEDDPDYTFPYLKYAFGMGHATPKKVNWFLPKYDRRPTKPVFTLRYDRNSMNDQVRETSEEELALFREYASTSDEDTNDTAWWI